MLETMRFQAMSVISCIQLVLAQQPHLVSVVINELFVLERFETLNAAQAGLQPHGHAGAACRVGTFHHVIVVRQNTGYHIKLMTAGIVHVTNLTPGSRQP
jgi:hypothetical protein